MKRNIAIILIVLLSIMVLTGCKKEEVAPVVEKEFTLEKATEEPAKEEEKTEEAAEVDKLAYVLYLKVEDKPYIYDEFFEIDLDDEKLKDKEIYEFVLEHLLEFEGLRDLITPVPEGTVLNKITNDKGNLMIDFSSEFMPTKISKEDAGVIIASVVNTMVFLQEVDTVSISIDGVSLSNYYGYKVNDKMEFIEDFFADK